ncbi:fumarylacetoacetate hydrolase family protein [Rhodococcus sp. G-MC3]|uniref:fumarylacetoacetate hydrolase family protein n=1 Tax=Rhodococcus sp. G-MC3 TaxID=3046209 RepID=UPI0024B9C04C|nr:fumarylacetoacetate hydrolase family protein [Rhodococcus sp. G-MC3]MDJ0396405.1 fumarylacetoacetate hydrolase family protein [Rhodococcus sp. G-MC3]
MRIANIDERLTLAVGSGYVDVATASDGKFGPDPQAIYDDWAAFVDWAAHLDIDAQSVNEVDVDTRWGPPVPRPRQVFAIGLNYHDHAAESGLASPTVPPVFTKFPSSLTGHNQSVVLPADTVDWEVELVAVIGTRCDFVSEADAWDHIAGVTVGQDLSERQLQLTGPAPQFSLGKSFRGFAPTGPELVTVDELPNRDDLEIGCALSETEVLQRGRTSNLIFTIPQLIAHLSVVCPLLPGDLIFTGTPAGVGGARNPKKFLRPGEVLTSWIEGVGTLRNPMIAQQK